MSLVNLNFYDLKWFDMMGMTWDNVLIHVTTHINPQNPLKCPKNRILVLKSVHKLSKKGARRLKEITYGHETYNPMCLTHI